MLGTLRVIPSAEAKRPQRIITLRQIPSPAFLSDLVGGEAQHVESFDSILHDGQVVPCVVYVAKDARTGTRKMKPNTWANLLWLQALVRKQGFTETDRDALDHIAGPVVILHGDGVFMHHLLH
jgi:hypothetical protein